MNSDKWVVKWGILKVEVRNHDKLNNFFDLARQRNKLLFKFDDIKTKEEKISNSDSENINLYKDLIDTFKERKEVVNLCSSSSYTSIEHSADNKTPCYLHSINPFKFKVPYNSIDNPILKKHNSHGAIKWDFDFNIIYDGHIYMIYWNQKENNNIFGDSFIIRELLCNIINSSGDFSAVPIPPTPFREDLVFKFLPDRNSNQFEIKSIKDKLYVQEFCIGLPHEAHEYDFFDKFYLNLRSDFSDYFRLLERSVLLDDLFDEIHNKMTVLTLTSHQFQVLGSSHILKRMKLKNQIGIYITELFNSYSDYLLHYSSFVRDKEKTFNSYPDNKYLNKYKDKYKKEIEIDSCNFDLINSLINYSKDIIAVSEGNYSTIMSAIIGAVIGGIVVLISA
jgi:hypothetical protein